MSLARLLSIVLAVLATAACSAGRAEPESGRRDPVTPRDLTVHRGRFEDRFLLTGQLIAVNADSLFVPRLPNWQTTIRWLEAEGAIVKAGQKLVEFDTAALAQEYSEKRSAVDEAESDLEQAEADRASRAGRSSGRSRRRSPWRGEARCGDPGEFVRGKEYQDNQLALTRATSEFDKAKEDLAARGNVLDRGLQKRIAVEKRAGSSRRRASDGRHGAQSAARRIWSSPSIPGRGARSSRRFGLGQSPPS
jgi:multidrug efflux pump subunit AcrA (membrane-fusion protein)